MGRGHHFTMGDRDSPQEPATINVAAVSMFPRQWQVKMPAVISETLRKYNPFRECYYLLQQEQVGSSIPSWLFL